MHAQLIQMYFTACPIQVGKRHRMMRYIRGKGLDLLEFEVVGCPGPFTLYSPPSAFRQRPVSLHEHRFRSPHPSCPNPFQKILLFQIQRGLLKSHGSPRLYSSILDALLQINHTALLRPHTSNHISNQCTYLLLYVPKALLKKSARLSDWQRLEFSLYK